MKYVVVVLMFITAICVYANKGDTVSQFTLSGQPADGVRGLAYDPADGNIWCAGPNAIYNIIFAKFKNDTTHEIVQNWQSVENQYWVFDIGYKYTYSGKDCLVFCGKDGTRIWLKDPANGKHIGDIPDPFNGGYDEGIEGNYDSSWGVTLYATNYVYTLVRKWNGSSWENFAICSSPPMGLAYGWGYVFVIHTSSLYSIWVFRASDGSKVEEIPLTYWGTKYMVGLARGRDNYNGPGTGETLYTAVFYPSNLIYEIDIGNYNQQEIEPTSVGNIKALYK